MIILLTTLAFANNQLIGEVDMGGTLDGAATIHVTGFTQFIGNDVLQFVARGPFYTFTANGQHTYGVVEAGIGVHTGEITASLLFDPMAAIYSHDTSGWAPRWTLAVHMLPPHSKIAFVGNVYTRSFVDLPLGFETTEYTPRIWGIELGVAFNPSAIAK